VPESVPAVWLVHVSDADPFTVIVPCRPVNTRRNVIGTTGVLSGAPNVSSSVVWPSSLVAPESTNVPADVV
jgi:hypothetical protein